MWLPKSDKPKKKRKKRQKTERQKLLERLDAVFSLWIRKRDKGVCFTCGKHKDIKEMQNGHYVSRGKMSLRFDEFNCHCQCFGCNMILQGNMDEYAFRIIERYGVEKLNELRRKKWEHKSWAVPELQDLIKKYSPDP